MLSCCFCIVVFTLDCSNFNWRLVLCAIMSFSCLIILPPLLSFLSQRRWIVIWSLISGLSLAALLTQWRTPSDWGKVRIRMDRGICEKEEQEQEDEEGQRRMIQKEEKSISVERKAESFSFKADKHALLFYFHHRSTNKKLWPRSSNETQQCDMNEVLLLCQFRKSVEQENAWQEEKHGAQLRRMH